jgi:hypothetical protein
MNTHEDEYFYERENRCPKCLTLLRGDNTLSSLVGPNVPIPGNIYGTTRPLYFQYFCPKCGWNTTCGEYETPPPKGHPIRKLKIEKEERQDPSGGKCEGRENDIHPTSTPVNSDVPASQTGSAKTMNEWTTVVQMHKDAEHSARLNVTYRTSDDTETVTLWSKDHRVGVSYLYLSGGFRLEAYGVNNALWIPWHRIVDIELMGTAPEKPRSDRHEDY